MAKVCFFGVDFPLFLRTRIVDHKRDKRGECPGHGTNWEHTLYAAFTLMPWLTENVYYANLYDANNIFRVWEIRWRYEVSKGKRSCREYALWIQLEISQHESRVSIRLFILLVWTILTFAKWWFICVQIIIKK